VLLRPLAVILALLGVDYLLWDWSLSANHGAVAVAAGLTLPPLVVALLWLILRVAWRGLGRAARRHVRVTASRADVSRPDNRASPRSGETAAAGQLREDQSGRGEPANAPAGTSPSRSPRVAA
jgi:hypothetical protein